MQMEQGAEKIAVIGLGYVGLPLAILLSKQYAVTGYDYASHRIAELANQVDKSAEVTAEELADAFLLFNKTKGNVGLQVTDIPDTIAQSSIFIIAVPTPVDQNHLPDLSPLKAATELVARHLKKGDLVIYESTVYPGCTEEVAVPILEQVSRLTYNLDFTVGYSPERMNPGDKQRRLADIVKVTSGSNSAAASRVNNLYASIIKAGTYLAPSIKIAEASKVVENTQRDINIAYMNELSKVFTALDIDMKEVAKAAATKWNFLPFHPGLVGGHCIGVDPYYLIHRSMQAGYEPTLLKSARVINNSMGDYVAARMLALLAKKQIAASTARVLIMGIAFKENTADIRNSRVVELINQLIASEVAVDIYDPLVDAQVVRESYGLTCLDKLGETDKYDGIIIAVRHATYNEFEYSRYLKPRSVLYDLHGIVSGQFSDGTL
ncbi:MAG: nucleotide sugar dehydrogenase [Chitinophagia bacterium]